MKISRLAATLLVCAVCGFILHKYEYTIAFTAVDNAVGMLPVALVLTTGISAVFLLWKKHDKRHIADTVMAVFMMALSIALFPLAIRGNWWIGTVTSDVAEAAPDLLLYAPFGEGSLTAKLSEAPVLRISDGLPVLDGATALYPVYAAFAEAVYDEAAFTPDAVLCTNTANAYSALVVGERDVIFVAGASARQLAAAQDAGAELCFTPIGREAFVFLVGKDNPVESITYQEIRNIYTGKTAYWTTLGWLEGGRIIAFQRPEGSGSQTGLQTIMGKLPIQVPQPLPDTGLIGTNSLMRQVSLEWRGVQPAIGYSYRYYATSMYTNPEAKLLRVDDVEPSIANMQNGHYPFTADFYAVTRGAPEGNTKRLIDWILSSQGQAIIENTGYAPVH